MKIAFLRAVVRMDFQRKYSCFVAGKKAEKDYEEHNCEMLTSQWITKAAKFGRYDKKSYLRGIKPKNCTKNEPRSNRES